MSPDILDEVVTISLTRRQIRDYKHMIHMVIDSRARIKHAESHVFKTLLAADTDTIRRIEEHAIPSSIVAAYSADLSAIDNSDWCADLITHDPLEDRIKLYKKEHQ